MSVKRAFFGIFQKLVVFCCAIFFGFSNAFSANLPSGYTELEYIESTGTQWLNTGVELSFADINFDIKFEFVSTQGTQGIFGYLNNSISTTNFYLTKSSTNTKFIFASGTNAQDISYSVQSATPYTIVLNDSNLKINGTSFNVSRGNLSSGNEIYLFNRNNSQSSLFVGNIYYFKIYNGDTLVRNFVPAKDSSGVVGMYDTVNNMFYTNSGTGTFTAGPVVLNPCRNLFDEGYPNPTGVLKYKAIYVGEGTFTCSYSMPHNVSNTSMVYFLPGNVSSGASNNQNQVDATYPRTVTAVDGYVTIAYGNGTSIGMGNAVPSDYHAQIERGATATDYVPFCAAEIKIATTAYNSARFSPVVNDLNTTIATIRDIVTNTINQTAAIASLQADKQTRPEDACPAGKKCLLVETEENGVIVPHWYEIIENIYGLPAGYTALEYIEGTGTQYIDTGLKLNQNNIVEVDWMYYTESTINTSGRIFGARYTSGSRNSFAVGSNTGKSSAETAVFGQFDNNSVLASNNIVIGQWNTYKVSADGFYINDIKQGDLGGSTFETPFTVKLFAFEQASSSSATPSIGCGVGRSKQFKVWNGDTLVMNLIPAKNSSNIVGMYDTVNDVFYTNSGTGTFTAGPEI